MAWVRILDRANEKKILLIFRDVTTISIFPTKNVSFLKNFINLDKIIFTKKDNTELEGLPKYNGNILKVKRVSHKTGRENEGNMVDTVEVVPTGERQLTGIS